jgi:hypothetical protein
MLNQMFYWLSAVYRFHIRNDTANVVKRGKHFCTDVREQFGVKQITCIGLWWNLHFLCCNSLINIVVD